jgi:hypothetical protein
MALKGDGYKLIADKFQADANQVRLIGVKLGTSSGDYFKGVFNTLTDLESAYPGADQTVGDVAFVKTNRGDGSVGYMRVNAANDWLKAELVNFTDDERLHLEDELEWEFTIAETPSYTATTISNSVPLGQPLKLSSPMVFNITSLPANTSGVIVQGIKFRKYVNAQTSDDYYVWGFGTDDWASFTEPGEFIVTDWNFKLGGFGG